MKFVFAIAAIVFFTAFTSFQPTATAGVKVLYGFDNDTGGWWTFASGANITLSNDKTGAEGSTGSLLASYQWRPGSSSYLGLGVEPKWSMGDEKWSAYSSGQMSIDLKSDIPVDIRIELRASDKLTYAYTLTGVPSVWRDYKLPFALFTSGGKKIDLNAVDIGQIVLIPTKVDESPHSLWVDQIGISASSASAFESHTDEGVAPAPAAVEKHLVPVPFKVTGHPLEYTGVNMAGGDFANLKPGQVAIYGKDFVYPDDRELTYFAARGVNIIRLPFLWEVLQPDLNGPILPDQLSRLKAVVTLATSKRLTVLIDPHDYERYFGKVIGGPDVSNSSFDAFWTALANTFKDNPRVWFGLINEPHDVAIDQWMATAQGAIDSIRSTGSTNKILIPGEGYTGAHSWLDTHSDELLLLKDTANNNAFEVHQYLDSDSSGSHPDAVSPSIGVERLQTFTEWLKKNHRKAFLGEFGTAQGENNKIAIDNMLNYMGANRDVWLGFTWWAAGPWWGDYMYTVEPTKDGQDRPQLFYLTPYLHGI